MITLWRHLKRPMSRHTYYFFYNSVCASVVSLVMQLCGKTVPSISTSKRVTILLHLFSYSDASSSLRKFRWRFWYYVLKFRLLLSPEIFLKQWPGEAKKRKSRGLYCLDLHLRLTTWLWKFRKFPFFSKFLIIFPSASLAELMSSNSFNHSSSS